MMEIVNAKITRVTLGMEDHGILTSYVMCDMGSSSQGFGGYDLRYDNACANFVLGIQRVLGVDDWSKIVGQYYIHVTRIVAEPLAGVRAVCDCGFVGTLYYDSDFAWNQALEHELQNMEGSK